ncbi:MAG TPA: hypothetical protein VEC56_11695, partial [Candidatus Krumholzibacteria bacterium]|nr:hypothetical protein [Candidatus Krumholzibacteria bacterium]
ATVAVISLLHVVLTARFYGEWSADALWFLAAGLGLLLLAVVNWAHVGLEPCRLPTAPVVLWANVVYLLLGVAALVAVPQVQAVLLVAGLAAQAVAGRFTLRAPA